MRAMHWVWGIGLAVALAATDGAQAADPSAAATGNLHFRSDASARFELVEARFAVDGDLVPTAITNAERGKDYVVILDPLPAGRHVITTHLLYRPKTRKVFTYMNGYRFDVRSDEVVTALPDHSATFTIVGMEASGVNTPIDRALTVKVETNIVPPEAGEPTAGGPGTPGEAQP